MTPRRTRTTALAAITLLSAALTACGAEEDAPTAAAGPSRASDPLAGLTGEPVRIMTIGNWTQPQLGTSNPEFPAGAQAAAAAVNAAGGIAGRPLEVVVCSDELNADVAGQCARSALEQGVVAVVGLQTTNETTVLPILESAEVPAVGVYPFTDVALTSPVSYPDVSGFSGQTYGMGRQLAAGGNSTVSVVVPGGLGGIATAMSDAIEAGAVDGGAEFAGTVQVPARSSDLSSVVTAATDDGAAVAGFSTDEAEFIRSMRTLAPGSDVTTFPFNLTQDVLDSAGDAAEGVLSVEGFVPPSADTPGTRQYAEELAAFDPSLPLSSTGLHEWLATWTFARVVADLTEVTPQTVAAAYDEVRDLDMGGVTPPYSTVATSGAPRMFNSTVVFQVVTDGEIVVQDADDPFTAITLPAAG